MFNSLTKVTIIEYLINEIDCLIPVEDVYEKYCNVLYKISDLNFNLTYTSYKQKFIMKITSMTKKDILEFCKKEGFVVSINLVELVLKRKLSKDDYDLNYERD